MFIQYLFEAPEFYFIALAVVILSIVLHELGHALAATWQGDPTPRIRGHLTWNPVVHMGWLSLGLAAIVGIAWGLTPTTPRLFRNRRWGDAIVSFAGPAVNIFLVLVAAAVLHALPEPTGLAGAYALMFWQVLLRWNVVLFLLNLIPVPPLDGFHVLEGVFDLGNFGEMLKRASPVPLLVAILIVQTSAFNAVVKAVVTVFAPGRAL